MFTLYGAIIPLVTASSIEIEKHIFNFNLLRISNFSLSTGCVPLRPNILPFKFSELFGVIR
jgi:hypothetical protein